MKCVNCGCDMVSGAGVWSGIYNVGKNVDLSMSLVGKEPWGEGNVFMHGQVVLTPTPWVCPVCGRVDLMLSKKQVKKYEEVINHHVLRVDQQLKVDEVIRSKKAKFTHFIEIVISTIQDRLYGKDA